MVLNLLQEGRRTNSHLLKCVGSAPKQLAFFWTQQAYRVQIWEKISHSALCCTHYLGHVISVLCRAAAMPTCHTMTDDAFCCVSIEVCQQSKGEPSLFVSWERKPLLGLIYIDGLSLFQVFAAQKFIEMFTTLFTLIIFIWRMIEFHIYKIKK